MQYLGALTVPRDGVERSCDGVVQYVLVMFYAPFVLRSLAIPA
jgi:hypothetical protein